MVMLHEIITIPFLIFLIPKAIGYVAGYLSYIRSNLVNTYGSNFTSLTNDEQSRVILQGYNMGIEGLEAKVAKYGFEVLMNSYAYHKQTLDGYRRWRQ